MTLPEFEILTLLARWGPLTSTELRDSAGPESAYHWQAYAARLRELEKRGFVWRKDPVAGVWDLTDTGRELTTA